MNEDTETEAVVEEQAAEPAPEPVVKQIVHEVHVNGECIARYHQNGASEDDEIEAHPAARARIKARQERRKDPTAKVVIVKDTLMEAPEGDVGGGEGDKKPPARRSRNTANS